MKIYKFIFLALGVALLSTSCLVDDEDEKLDAMSDTMYAFGFNPVVKNIAYFEDLGPVEKPIAVEVFGGGDGDGVEQDVLVSYEINENSTATMGQEYTINGTVGQVLVPAGSELGIIDLVVNTGQLNPNEPTQLIIDIIDVSIDNAGIITKNKTIVVNFVGCQSTLDQYTYDVTVSVGNQPIYTGTEQILVIPGSAPNTFRTQSSGGFGPGGLSPPANYDGFNFVDVCGVITIPEQNLGGYYSNLLFGEGSVDPDTGTITLIYTITFAAGNNVYTVTYERV